MLNVVDNKIFQHKIIFRRQKPDFFCNWEWLPMEMEMVRAECKKMGMEMVKQEMEMELVTTGNGVVNNYQWKW